MNNHYPFELNALPYDYACLQPSISKTTLEYHHDKHLKTYVANLNDTLAKAEALQDKTLTYLLTHLKELPAELVTPVTNNGGGVYNHNLYFSLMTAPGSKRLEGSLKEDIINAFGSEEEFLAEFKKAALAQFGSGYAWLVMDGGGRLKITKTANQDTPLKDGLIPLLLIDVWEHAYYLDYQNLRASYIDAFFQCINWDVVAERYLSAKKA